MGFDTEEFDYLEDEKNKTDVIESLPKVTIKVKPIIEVKEDIKEEGPKFETDSLIFIVKVTTNKESKAIELIADKVKKEIS